MAILSESESKQTLDNSYTSSTKGQCPEPLCGFVPLTAYVHFSQIALEDVAAVATQTRTHTQ